MDRTLYMLKYTTSHHAGSLSTIYVEVRLFGEPLKSHHCVPEIALLNLARLTVARGHIRPLERRHGHLESRVPAVDIPALVAGAVLQFREEVDCFFDELAKKAHDLLASGRRRRLENGKGRPEDVLILDKASPVVHLDDGVFRTALGAFAGNFEYPLVS